MIEVNSIDYVGQVQNSLQAGWPVKRRARRGQQEQEDGERSDETDELYGDSSQQCSTAEGGRREGAGPQIDKTAVAGRPACTRQYYTVV